MSASGFRLFSKFKKFNGHPGDDSFLLLRGSLAGFPILKVETLSFSRADFSSFVHVSVDYTMFGVECYRDCESSHANLVVRFPLGFVGSAALVLVGGGGT